MIKNNLVAAALAVALLAGCETVNNEQHVAGVNIDSLAPPPAPVIEGLPVEVVGHPDPLSLLHHSDPALARNKRLVFDFWRSVVNGGHVEVADELMTENYIQHSPVLPTGRKAFKDIFSVIPRQEKIPELVSPPLISIIAEDDLVAMTLVETLPNPDDNGSYSTTHFNLFRIENGLLAEHWHSVQTPPGPDVLLPEDGGPQLVTGVSGVDQFKLLDAKSPQLAENKRLLFDVYRQIVDAGREELADLYLHEDYIQHNPNTATGRAAFKSYFATRDDLPIDITMKDPVVAMVAEGDLVVLALKREHPHPHRPGKTFTTTYFGMFRVVDGRLAEHWGVATKASRN